MTQEDLQMLDEILKTKNTDYSSVKTVAKAVTSIMLTKDKARVESLYDYIKAGFEARSFNVLEFFGQKYTASVSGTLFYSASDMFTTHGFAEKAKALSALRKTVTKEAERDYAEAYRLYSGTGGTRVDLKTAAKKCVTAICKDPPAAAPRILLAHLLSNDDKGITVVHPIAAWILNGIQINNSATAKDQREKAIALAKSFSPRSYILDENLIGNRRFLTSGTPACSIDFMGENITATRLHRLPTPAFFYQLANDFSGEKKASIRTLDACTLYDLAHFMDPNISVPDAFTMGKRALYLAEYRRELGGFLNEMNAAVKQAEDAQKEHLAREQEKRNASISEALEIVSSERAKADAAKAASEIEIALYDSGFFGHK